MLTVYYKKAREGRKLSEKMKQRHSGERGFFKAESGLAGKKILTKEDGFCIITLLH